MTGSRQLKSVLIFGNGSVAVLDTDGRQVPELQGVSVVDWIIERAESIGYAAEGCRVQFTGGRVDVGIRG